MIIFIWFCCSSIILQWSTEKTGNGLQAEIYLGINGLKKELFTEKIFFSVDHLKINELHVAHMTSHVI